MAAKKSFLLRIDPKVWRSLDQWAKDELRKVNGPIEYILRDAVNQRRRGRRSQPPSSDENEDLNEFVPSR